MATTAKTATETKTAKVETRAAGPAVKSEPVEILDIPVDQPYPTGAPQGPVTYAEINGLLPVVPAA